jgi:DsbC/DsbD-like thiol-disulfide interchange protein
MSRSRIAFVLLFSLFTLASCSRSATKSTTLASVDVVKATAQPVDLTVGSTAEAIVHLTIQSGYHINANPPSYPYLKATELEIPAGEGVSVGFITYPNPITKQFSFSDKSLAVYEGELQLKIMLKADKSAKQGERSLAARLRVQACDNEVCYPPGVLDLSVPVRIK